MGLTGRGTAGLPGEILVLQKEVSDLFERLSEFESETEGPAQFRPPLDIFECGTTLTIVVELPGFTPDRVSVTMNRDVLTISGERRTTRKPGVDGFVCMERPRGRFVRRIRIDRPVDLGKAEARLGRGLLTVQLPAMEDRRGRDVPIPVVREEDRR